MTVLCIETSTSVCSAAICKDGAAVKQFINYDGSNHARLLPVYIQQLLDFSQEQSLSIDAVALSEGPGSYTGLRIGTATAKGLCYGLDVPLIPIPTLDILNAASGQTGHLCPMIDARRMEVYTSGPQGARAVVVENEDSLYSGEDEVCYFGDGAAKCAQIFTKTNWHYIPDIVPEAQFMGRLAENATRKVEGKDLAYYEPYYLKEFVAAQSHVKGLK